MNLILTVARLEFRYHIRQSTFYLFAVIILAQGVWNAYRLNQDYAMRNSTMDTYYVLASFGLALAIVAVLLAGQSLTKDATFRMTSLLHVLPINSRVHFAGRFLGTYLTVLTLAAFYPLGTLLLPVTYGAADVPWLVLLDGFVWLIALNSFILVSITFSLTVFLRSSQGAYFVLFLVFLYFLLPESGLDIGTRSDIWLLLDPFGVGMLRESIDNLAFSDPPDALLSFSDMLLINRLLWLGISFGLLEKAETLFTFNTFDTKQASKPLLPEEKNNTVSDFRFPIARQQFRRWDQLQTLAHLTRLQFLNLIKQPAFQITLILLVILIVLQATTFDLQPDFPELPITSRMTALRLPMGLFIGSFLLVMTGELIFHERTTGIWVMYDALPQPTFVLLTAKLIVMVCIAALLTFLLFITGIGIQLNSSFSPIDWSRYASDLLMDGFLRYCQLIGLGAFIAALTGNRFLSHLINLFIFGLLSATYQLSERGQSIFLFSFLPGSASFSDLIGYGTNASIRPIVHTTWWALAGLFITLSLLTWNRGATSRLRERIGQWRQRASWTYGLPFVLFSTFFGLGLWAAQQQRLNPTASDIQRVHYAIKTITTASRSGRAITILVMYKHPYQVRHIINAAHSAIHRGEQLFGAYPFPAIRIVEVPDSPKAIRSASGQVLLSEKEGWTADNQKPDQLDYINYLISREVFNQWLVHKLKPAKQPGNGFMCHSLAEYLALQVVAKEYGTDRLKQRLRQRTSLYTSQRHNSKPEASLLQTFDDEGLDRGRTALVLNSIGQVWGDTPLSLTIGQFYKQAIQKPVSATANAFAQQLSSRLPDSLRYLTTYLRDPLWFDFKVGRVANLPNGLAVDILATKWQERTAGQREPLLINDYIPLVVLDNDGREIYRQLIHPNPDKRTVLLPTLPTARSVRIDPLGSWPELNKRDNYKIF